MMKEFAPKKVARNRDDCAVYYPSQETKTETPVKRNPDSGGKQMSPLVRTVKPVTMSAFAPIVLTLFAASSARAAPFTFSVVNTPIPNWALGDPQVAAVGVCSVLAGSCGNLGFGALENEVGIALLTAPATFGGFTLNGDSFTQEAAGRIGADVRVPTAFWLAPAVYTWAGGGVAFFNSIVGGVAYANELVVLDPPPDPYTWLENFSVDLGDIAPLPSPDTSLSPNSDGNVNVPAPQLDEVPEPATKDFLLIGLGAGLLWRLRRAEA
jgi:hypothetical protein